MSYTAVVNVPGYLPESEPAVFGTASDAWSYLADERREAESQVPLEDGADDIFSDVVSDLDAHAAANVPGVVYGPAPGHRGSLAYCVTETEE